MIVISRTRKSVYTVPEVIPYEYGDPNWKDKLTSYNGADITYDEIGNPKDDGERVYTWAAGRQLQQIVVKEPNEITVTSGTGNGGATVVNLVKTALHRLKVQVLHNGEDITAEADSSQFVWCKRENASAAWVQEAVGVKELKLSQEDREQVDSIYSIIQAPMKPVGWDLAKQIVKDDIFGGLLSFVCGFIAGKMKGGLLAVGIKFLCGDRYNSLYNKFVTIAEKGKPIAYIEKTWYNHTKGLGNTEIMSVEDVYEWTSDLSLPK